MSNEETLISLKEKILLLEKEKGRLQAKVNFYVGQTIDQFKEIKDLRRKNRVLLDQCPPEERMKLEDATPPKEPTLTPPAPFDAPCI
jgi:hypothetical protein